MTGLKDRGIIHANIPSDHTIDVMADLQQRYDAGSPEPSSTFTWWLGNVYSSKFGPSRSPQLNPFKSFVSKSVIWANGSDFPVVPFPARFRLRTSPAFSTSRKCRIHSSQRNTE